MTVISFNSGIFSIRNESFSIRFLEKIKISQVVLEIWKQLISII